MKMYQIRPRKLSADPVRRITALRQRRVQRAQATRIIVMGRNLYARGFLNCTLEAVLEAAETLLDLETKGLIEIADLNLPGGPIIQLSSILPPPEPEEESPPCCEECPLVTEPASPATEALVEDWAEPEVEEVIALPPVETLTVVAEPEVPVASDTVVEMAPEVPLSPSTVIEVTPEEVPEPEYQADESPATAPEELPIPELEEEVEEEVEEAAGGRVWSDLIHKKVSMTKLRRARMAFDPEVETSSRKKELVTDLLAALEEGRSFDEEALLKALS